MRFIIVAIIVLAVGFPVQGKTPEWIWVGKGAEAAGTNYFRKVFRTPPLLWNAQLSLSADDEAEVFLNGVAVAKCEGWEHPIKAEVSVRLNQGENVLAVRVMNRKGPGGLVANLNLGGETNVVTDATWLVSTNQEPGWAELNFNAFQWQSAVVLGEHGMAPWGEILFRPSATPAAEIKVLPGFEVSLLRSATPEEGSWVCMTFDERGRLIISPEGDERPLLRMSLTNGSVAAVKKMEMPIRFAMGLLPAHGSLYANAKGPGGSGLYKLTDANQNDRFEASEIKLLKRFEGGSEHGYHALALGPDEKIYVLNGNGTKLPEGVSARSTYRNYAEDMLSFSPNSAFESEGASPPACYVLRTDADGKEWELWAGGMRNAYDFDFNADGELFTFDSDMEWDWGTPWYRGTRIVHLVSGGESGWRDGMRMWADEYPDSNPPVVYIGIGSPTGVKFGTKSAFPEEYRKALFAQDWSYGRIVAVHLEPKGGTYQGEFETFLSGKPLNLTSLAFGPDGAMYFITGGRGTQSGLYRVTYTGGESKSATLEPETAVAGASRETRRKIERLHTVQEKAAGDFLWPHLGSKDGALRFAARVALEAQDPGTWSDRALDEREPKVALAALLALTRTHGKDVQPELLEALGKLNWDSLDEQEKLEKLRILQISLYRHGIPKAEQTQRILGELNHRFPARSWALNRELSRVLVYLKAPGVVPKTIALLERAPTQEQQYHYIAVLRDVRDGWTEGDRERYFEWFQKSRAQENHPENVVRWFSDVGRKYVDGAWINRYLREFRKEAVASLTERERDRLGKLIETPVSEGLQVPAYNRAFVQEWTMADFVSSLADLSKPRNLERGRKAFVEAQCLSCHRFGNDGGPVGPELNGVGSKYSARDILEAILDPSRVVSEQYQDTTIVTRDAELWTGRLLTQSDESITLETDRVSGTREEIPRKEVASMKPSSLSPMPAGLVNILTKEEVLDLIAFLQHESLSNGTGNLPKK